MTITGANRHICHKVREANSITPENVLSAANKSKCIKLLKSMNPVNLRIKGTNKVSASVLVPMCLVQNQLSLLYTVRSKHLKTNGGEVSFPGGKQDKSDGTLMDTALRETFEEIGIPREKVDIWGSASVIQRPDMSVTPFLAYIENLDIKKLTINKNEVDMVFTATLNKLSSSDNFNSTQFRFGTSYVYTTPVYTGMEKRIWGLTALITHTVLSSVISDVYNANIQFKPKYQKIFCSQDLRKNFK